MTERINMIVQSTNIFEIFDKLIETYNKIQEFEENALTISYHFEDETYIYIGSSNKNFKDIFGIANEEVTHNGYHWRNWGNSTKELDQEKVDKIEQIAKELAETCKDLENFSAHVCQYSISIKLINVDEERFKNLQDAIEKETGAFINKNTINFDVNYNGVIFDIRIGCEEA